jgi:superfamily II DNA/RNA helicase
VSMNDQIAKLDRGVDVLIATPGRLLDLFERSKVLLTGVSIMVVDEADRMLDMGFIPDIERIFKMTPPKKQTLFFSATMPPEITRLTKQFLNNPVRIEASRPAQTATTITQYLVRVPLSEPKAKRMALRELINADDVKNGIVFCNRKSEVDVVAKSLKVHGIDAAPIHGDLDQSLRMKTLADFRSGALRILVGSDVAARGLDIPDVSHVFNYDVPHHADDYVHRIGRTGRAGKLGKTYMIITPADAKGLDKVIKLIGENPEEIKLDLDWSQAEGDTARRREREKERGGGREKGRSRTRDRDRERPRADHGERASETPIQAAPAAERSAPAAAVEAPAREDARPTRAERAPRQDRAPRTEQKPRQDTRPPQGEARSDRRPSREDREDRDDKKVVGFGDDLPAFLRR